MNRKAFFWLMAEGLGTVAVAQVPVDTTRVYDIPEVVVSERLRTREVRAVAPLQLLGREELGRLNALQVADAVKHFAGVTVRDYGGIGGLKTVSVRSLGAQHTAVGYDGIAVTDCQTGQIDLGRFSLENVDRLALSTGQEEAIFQPARFYAAAGLLNIQTLAPVFREGQTMKVKASVKSGSWGLLQPALRVERRLSSRWSLSADAEAMRSDGHYPYTLLYSTDDGESARLRRSNTEVRSVRTEVSAVGRLRDESRLRLKAYWYASSRGLPGAATYYYDHSAQHLWDKNAFVQGHYHKELGERWAVKAAAKWNWSYQHYLDPDYKGSEGRTENRYYQQEYYLSASALYRAFPHLSFALSTDGSVNRMNADLRNFARPVRYAWLTALAAKYAHERVTATASLLATAVYEDALSGGSAGNHHRLSPYIGLSVRPFAQEAFRVRAFYKDVFRLPSFNDLYYGQTGNLSLRPERARQFNVGLTYSRELGDRVPQFALTVDAYVNRVDDKIVATPTKNLFVWSMVNLGKVDIQGIDFSGNVELCPADGYRLHLSGNYTYQRALDVTDADPATLAGQTYRHQIAYTPRVSGAGQASLDTPWGTLSYALLCSGKRYVLGQNLAKNRLAGYADHSLSVRRDFRWRQATARLQVEALNLLDKNYEIIKNFPMPGRSLRVTVGINY